MTNNKIFLGLMLDLETLGNTNDILITQIGAVAFDPEIKAKWLENFKGIKHNPIDDCKCQIGYISEILHYIKSNELIAREE